MNPSALSHELRVGDRASLTKTFSEQDVVAFSQISGDRNPLHLDEDFARRTRFGHRVAHGMLTAGLISAVLGTQLPGVGCIYISQTLKFRSPVYIGDKITAIVEVTAVSDDKSIVTLLTTCKNQADRIVLEGEAVMLVPEQRT